MKKNTETMSACVLPPLYNSCSALVESRVKSTQCIQQANVLLIIQSLGMNSSFILTEEGGSSWEKSALLGCQHCM